MDSVREKRLMLGIPVLDSVSWQFFLHTSVLIGRLAREYELDLCFVNRSAIDRARELTVKDAIARECDYILFIDDDTLLQLDAVEKLRPLLDDNENAVCASGFCYQRGYKYLPMVYRYEGLEWGKGDSQLMEPFPNEPFQVSATGMGVSLIKVSLLPELEKQYGDCFGRDGESTEDFYFFYKCFQMKYESWLHPGVEGTHLGNCELINSKTANELRTRDHAIYFQPSDAGGRSQKGLIGV